MSDILLKILEDESNANTMQDALTALLHENPVAFYRDFVLPRLEKLKAGTSNVEHTIFTPAEEAAMMDEACAAFHKEHANTTETKPAAADTELAKV